MAALLKDALKPNLVQTLEGTPAFIHGGPFANIAHGCNSVMATRMALKLADYAVTEAGFGADLGAEKFLDIKCRMAGLAPRRGGGRGHGAGAEAPRRRGQGRPEQREPGGSGEGPAQPAAATWRTSPRSTACPAWWPSTAFPTDTEAELDLVEDKCRELGVNVALSEVWAQGRRGRHGPGRGGGAPRASEDEAEASRTFSLRPGRPVHRREDRGHRHASVYHADGVEFDRPRPQKQIAQLHRPGLRRAARVHGQDPVLASPTTPPSWARPAASSITVRKVKVSAGAGFIVALTGDIMTMPGLPKVPAAEKIDVDGRRAGSRGCSSIYVVVPGSDSERKCRAQTTLKCTVGVLLRHVLRALQ